MPRYSSPLDLHPLSQCVLACERGVELVDVRLVHGLEPIEPLRLPRRDRNEGGRGEAAIAHERRARNGVRSAAGAADAQELTDAEVIEQKLDVSTAEETVRPGWRVEVA